MEPALVVLDRDHPGFRDPVYRARRDQIARLAQGRRPNSSIPTVDYTPQEQQVWAAVLGALAPLHKSHASRELAARWSSLDFVPGSVPQLSDTSRKLARLTGFTMEPVAGMVSPRTFMSSLGRGVFLSTQYVRHHSSPLYTPEPDLIHELIGHAPQLIHPRFAEINRLFGQATDAVDDERLEGLVRLYWYALEFGVVNEEGQPRAVGAGLLSSIGELERFRTQATLLPFDPAVIARTPFDPTDFQPALFVAPSTDAMLDQLRAYLLAQTARPSVRGISMKGGSKDAHLSSE